MGWIEWGWVADRQAGGWGPVRWPWVHSGEIDDEWRSRSRNRGGGECHKEILKMAESLGVDDQLDMLNMSWFWLDSQRERVVPFNEDREVQSEQVSVLGRLYLGCWWNIQVEKPSGKQKLEASRDVDLKVDGIRVGVIGWDEVTQEGLIKWE